MPLFSFHYRTSTPVCVCDSPVFSQDAEHLNCPCALQPIKRHLNDYPKPIDEPELIDEPKWIAQHASYLFSTRRNKNTFEPNNK